MVEKYIKLVSVVTILILIVGIVMVYFAEGWYVVGAGRNGMEFNFLLIFCLLSLMVPLRAKGETAKS